MSEATSLLGIQFQNCFVDGFCSQNGDDIFTILGQEVKFKDARTGNLMGDVDFGVRIRKNCSLSSVLSSVARPCTDPALQLMANDVVLFELTNKSGPEAAKQKGGREGSMTKVEKKINFYNNIVGPDNASATITNDIKLKDAICAPGQRVVVILIFNGADFAEMGDYWRSTTGLYITSYAYLSNHHCANWRSRVETERAESRITNAILNLRGSLSISALAEIFQCSEATVKSIFAKADSQCQL